LHKTNDINNEKESNDFINQYKYEVPGLGKRLSLIKAELESDITKLIEIIAEYEVDKRTDLDNLCQIIMQNVKELEQIIYSLK